MHLVSSNKTGRKRNRNFERPKTLNFITSYSNQGRWGMHYLERGVNFSIPNCEFISYYQNRSVMMCNSERSPGRKYVDSGIKTNVC